MGGFSTIVPQRIPRLQVDWLIPSMIGPESDTATAVLFRTRNRAGTTQLYHGLHPQDDIYGEIGSPTRRFGLGSIYSLHAWYVYMRGPTLIYFPSEPNTHATLMPVSDGYSYIGTADRRLNTVRAINVIAGDIGFEEMYCAVCGQKFKENDSIVLKVRKVDESDRKILAVPVHSHCNPHELDERMLERHEREVLSPRGQGGSRNSEEVDYEVVWESPASEDYAYIHVKFSDGTEITPIVKIEATEEEVRRTITEYYNMIREQLNSINQSIERGREKMTRLGKSFKGLKGKVKRK